MTLTLHEALHGPRFGEVLDSIRDTRGPGWRNQLDAARTPRQAACALLVGAQQASSKAAAWSRVQQALDVLGLSDPFIAGTGRWPDLNAVQLVILNLGPSADRMFPDGPWK